MNAKHKIFANLAVLWRSAFCLFCFGLVASIILLFRILLVPISSVCIEDWIGLGAGLFVICLFLPLSLILYVLSIHVSWMSDMERKINKDN